jgi:hypothetical protein
MTDPKATHETEFVFRRLTDGLHLGGQEFPPRLWLAIVVPVLVAGLAYVIWMYRRDRRSIAAGWAVFLGALRSLVYILLAAIFLLPAWQVWDTSESRSQVLLLLDVSSSMATKDDLPTEAMPVEKLLSRQDKVVRFLTDSQAAFMRKLAEKNPVTAFRFGAVLDEESKDFNAQSTSVEADWGSWLKPDPKAQVPATLGESEANLRRKKADLAALLVNGTNLPDVVSTLVNREAARVLQGIVIISDGRSTVLSAQTLEDAKARAEKAKVPLFAVAVGEDRPQIRVRVTDLQAPEQVRPDDSFMVRALAEGEGLAGQPADITLEVTKPSGEKQTLKPNRGDPAVGGLLFRPGEPPQAQADFEINQPGDEGEWKLTARIPRDKRETTPGAVHSSDPVTVHVVKRPLRVLLFAGGPSRDYQFVRSLLVREMDRHRAEVSILLQPGSADIVQDVPPERLLRHFPNFIAGEQDSKTTADDRYYDLSRYDLIIAFDPDWTQLSPESMALLEKWVGTHAGGLIMVAGPVNTYQLARGVNFDKLKPILDLAPVIFEDSRVQGIGSERSTSEPWRLHFPGASPDLTFLKLDETGPDALAGWEDFFAGKAPRDAADTGSPHGFYTFYPLKGVKPNATVIATFSDPGARLADGKEQPYLVSMPYGSGRVVYLGSGETWRLREHRDVFHERFWTKLARYAGSGNLSRATKNGYISMGSSFRAGQYVPITARLFGRDLSPLGRSEHPVAQVRGPQDAKPIAVELVPKAVQASDSEGWFEGRYLARDPGIYTVSVPVPTTAEILTRKFSVKESNPEQDNTRPDFASLYALASDADQVFARIEPQLKSRVERELERTNGSLRAASSGSQRPLRLYFDLKAAHVIPLCMVTERKTQKSRGPIQDIWDDGPVVRSGDPPLKMSWALIIIVALLSTEWLVRKLLKLA